MNDTAAPHRILVLDDDADFRKLLRVFLGRMFERAEIEDYDPVARGVPGEDFDWSRYDVLILDYYLCIRNVTGLDILQANRKNRFFPATIMLTGAGNEEVAVRALKAGVYDYLRKESLDKEQFRRAILNAVEQHQEKQQRLAELTNHSMAFNKALFYRQLETAPPADAPDRVLLLIELDESEQLEERLGIILRDNIIRHLARESFAVFQVAGSNPQVTRLSDSAVAMMIDRPEGDEVLADVMTGLCEHLRKRPYRYESRKFPFTVSIGVVPLPREGRWAETLIGLARQASEMAAVVPGNHFYIHHAPGEEPAVPAFEREEEKSPTAEIPEFTGIESSVEIEGGPEESATPPEPEAAETEPIEAAEPEVPEPEVEPHGRESAQPEPAAGTRPPPVPPAAAPEVPAVPPARAKETAAPKPGRAAEPPVATRPMPAAPPSKAMETAARKPVPPAAAAKSPAAAKHPQSAPAPAAGVPPKPADLGESAQRILKAFEEKRVMQLFQPVISLQTTEADSEPEIFQVHMQLLDVDGGTCEEEQIYAASDSPEYRKYIDRWLLREAFGRVVANKRNNRLYLLRISGSSIADPGLFNWLRRLLSGLDSRHPGKFIVLEISAEDFAPLRKKAGALIDYLSKAHGFQFMLGRLDDAAEVAALAGTAAFGILRVNTAILETLQAAPAPAGSAGPSLLANLNAAGLRLLVEDIGDAMTLTRAIELGAWYAMGNFIGEPVLQIDESTNVEEFEIT
jgi:DNA-binding response OmpR family regulator/EAL domain-containing protein (putative c-di-GMP-specific phosphodiesterase class I)